MSYILCITSFTVPSGEFETISEWWETQRESDNYSSPSIAFRELHDKLVTKYPCISSVPQEEIDDAVWSDGPLINNFGQTTAVLGYVGDYEEAVDFTIQTALSMGFSVLDEQSGEVYRAETS